MLTLTSTFNPKISTKKEETKPKVTKKKNESQLEEREIDISTIKIEKKEEAKITSWVANSVEEVMKTDFKMEDHEHDFESLTDAEFNKKQKEVSNMSIFSKLLSNSKKTKRAKSRLSTKLLELISLPWRKVEINS